jgi:hypothetical protein
MPVSVTTAPALIETITLAPGAHAVHDWNVRIEPHSSPSHATIARVVDNRPDHIYAIYLTRDDLMELSRAITALIEQETK